MIEIPVYYFEATLKFPLTEPINPYHEKLLRELAENGRVVFSRGQVPLLSNFSSGSAQVFHYKDMAIRHQNGEFIVISNDRDKIMDLVALINKDVGVLPAKKRFPQA